MTRSPSVRTSLLFLAVACGAAAPAEPPAPSPVVPPPDYSAFNQSIRVPFSNKVDFDRLASMDVRVSINGGPALSVEVDTGSVGLIVGANQVPGIDRNAPPGHMNYSSSGVELDGVWTPATVTFLDARGADGRPVQARLPVLAAERTVIHPGAVNGRAGKARPAAKPAAGKPRVPVVHMLGIGFGRGEDGHPERNAFLNLVAMQAGTMRKGYTIARDGIHLGLTPADAGGGYLFEKLAERPVSPESAAMRPGLKDWSTAPGSVTVGDAAPVRAGILMDTGVTNFMVEIPPVTENKDVSADTPIAVDVLGDGRLTYTFRAGDAADPMAPRRVTYTHNGGWTVNTGLRALAGFDYLFDADAGYLALRPTLKRP